MGFTFNISVGTVDGSAGWALPIAGAADHKQIAPAFGPRDEVSPRPWNYRKQIVTASYFDWVNGSDFSRSFTIEDSFTLSRLQVAHFDSV